MSTTQDTESGTAQGMTIEVGLRAVLQFRYGIVNAANPLTAGAKVLGYENEYDMVFRLLTGGANAEKPKAKGAPGRETPEEAKIPDDELLLALEGLLEDTPAGVSGPDWYNGLMKAFADLGGTMEMTKTSFYARVKKMAATGAVKTSVTPMAKKMFGRSIMANVTMYTLPPEPEVPAKEGGAE